MNKNLIFTFALLLCSLITGVSANGQKVQAVSRTVPLISDKSTERDVSQAALRGAALLSAPEQTNYPRAVVTPWQTLSTVPGIAYRIKFVSETVGYLSGGSGLVYKTENGGQSWQLILQTGSTNHWYGLEARGADVFVAGFNNNATATEKGIMRVSRNFGRTWSGEIAVSKTDWLMNFKFANKNRGIIVRSPFSADPDGVFYSFYGGLKTADWRAATPTSADGWFGNQVSVLPSGRVDVSGINNCTSRNFGISWSCRSSVDSVFDGAVFFSDDQHGWVGGGIISPTQTGWVHSTVNGGQTWSGRTLNAPFAIRNIFFANNSVGWAMGGNYFANLGGIYGTTDGGASWTLELDTPHEIVSCDNISLSNGKKRVWCVGYGRNATTNITESKIFTVEK